MIQMVTSYLDLASKTLVFSLPHTYALQELRRRRGTKGQYLLTTFVNNSQIQKFRVYTH